jgi:small subunit ribosomal protein S4
MLERRLDNVVYRLGFAASRAQARRSCAGHFQVNGRRVNIPSYLVRPDDGVTVAGAAPRSRSSTTQPASPPRSRPGSRPTTRADEIDPELPERSEIDTPVQESLIVELYSK